MSRIEGLVYGAGPQERRDIADSIRMEASVATPRMDFMYRRRATHILNAFSEVYGKYLPKKTLEYLSGLANQTIIVENPLYTASIYAYPESYDGVHGADTVPTSPCIPHVRHGFNLLKEKHWQDFTKQQRFELVKDAGKKLGWSAGRTANHVSMDTAMQYQTSMLMDQIIYGQWINVGKESRPNRVRIIMENYYTSPVTGVTMAQGLDTQSKQAFMQRYMSLIRQNPEFLWYEKMIQRFGNDMHRFAFGSLRNPLRQAQIEMKIKATLTK